MEAAVGLMDRVKQQANALAQQANQSMAKLDNLPAQRRAESLLRSLGVAVLADKTGRATGDSEEQITRILADIEQHERQYNVDLVQQAAQAQQPWQPGAPGQPWQPGQPGPAGPPGQPWQQGQPGQPGPPGQPWQPPGGDFLTSSPPVDPNAPPPGAPGPGGYGGQPMSGPPGWGQQGTGQPGYGQPGGPTAFPPATSFPEATPSGTPDAEDEPGQPGQRGYFPPASGA
jgi:hypothetical protein